MGSRFSFVVLHYLSYELTDMCVKSVINLRKRNSEFGVDIIIVDNASNNGSFEQLKENYGHCNYIHFLHNDVNLGFSKGNNIGYKYALNNCSPDFVVIINNDTIIEQLEFMKNTCHVYNETNAFVLGPDVVNRNGEHQSPMRMKARDRQEVEAAIYKMTPKCQQGGISDYAPLRLRLKWFCRDIMERLPMFQRLLRERERRLSIVRQRQREHAAEDALLQGAALIFTPLFIRTGELPFVPETFLYCEEDILAIRCKHNGWHTHYDPDIKIIHLEDGSTDKLFVDDKEKALFINKHGLEAAQVLLAYGDQRGW
ncbi:glycosyltransferase family 2 protein [Bifidobacterium boum]|uniref:Glycosyl transferase family protein n=1 Tax=Bifidobacterium boum TaxID=78343 RepID=A0A086ZLR3_9BIFI|nr:glycosyltransferase [Bifidobacterium boum]KFI47463.1 glycosyl transferase family protein [Bifidobacterium boum]